MSDTLKVQSFSSLMNWILQEYETGRSVFGIHESLFYKPRPGGLLAQDLYGQRLGTPIGPAAGPHTQMAQNIVCSWLSGSRFIELKTVQVMDQLEIPRPCIDMEDEGYNVEWSQELRLEESADEYIKAWVLIHVLRRMLGYEDIEPFGTIFNMSVGYNLEGIKSPTMQRFMDRLQDASTEIAAIQATLNRDFPEYAGMDIPARITNNVSLSTMHGCPPDEIEKIATYLLRERGLHTAVKLNPTLLGKTRVHEILHDHCGYTGINVPDATFEHDLPYDRALELIRNLKAVAAEKGVIFGVKLSNTLPTVNHRSELPGDEMYMSGRALFPLTVNIFQKLMAEFDGDLKVSFSGGADAWNVVDLLACGCDTVTAVTDILKPGGYSRFLHYLENIEAAISERDLSDLNELVTDTAAALTALAASSLNDTRYHSDYHPHALPKVSSGLGYFDCITAPCTEKCAVTQDVPGYAGQIARGNDDQALDIILSRNPLPGVTGYICTHYCQTRCTRSDYDEPVAIRDLKRFAFEHGESEEPRIKLSEHSGHKVAIIGAGPSGLAAASFLALNGVGSTIFEARDTAGGMAAVAPGFRLPREVVNRDVARIEKMGVEIKLSHPITSSPDALLNDGFKAVYVACGFQKDAPMGIEGEEGDGVYGALEFLKAARRNEAPTLGDKVLVIGGGNTAMDATRTAQRLLGQPVTVVYRRTRAEMPADGDEIRDLLDEGNVLETLVSPLRIVLENGKVSALECVRNELGEPGEDGRRRPVAIPGSEFLMPADAVIGAIGQAADLSFMDGVKIDTRRNGAIKVDDAGKAADQTYAGGDAVRGPATIIEACADGRRAAEAICAQLDVALKLKDPQAEALTEEMLLQIKHARVRKTPRQHPEMLPVTGRGGFDLVEKTLSEAAARAEAARCLQCSLVCDKCVEVCPNRANYTYLTQPLDLMLPVLSCKGDTLVVVDQEAFQVAQSRQIVHLDDFCNECGNCATFCVHQGKPYSEKPRLFMDRLDFMLEDENAFHIDENTISCITGGVVQTLEILDDGLAFENPHVRLELTADFEVRGATLNKSFDGVLSLSDAATLLVLYRGVTGQ
jgi:putative selenate reductase